MAVHFNTRTKEPYLRLSAPHSNIIVTPHRLDQLDETCAVLTQWLNDPRVYPWLEGPPYPYLRQHAEGYIKMVCREHTQTLEALRVEGEGSSARQFHGSSPFLCIREVVAQDPETSDPLQDVFIGNVGLSRYSFYEYPSGSEQREEAVRQNNALPVGDGKIAWGLGYFLAPAYHGRGIMTNVIKTVLRDWGVPHMNARTVKGSAYVENEGSVRILEKNGFETE